jgi:hypothetical protein
MCDRRVNQALARCWLCLIPIEDEHSELFT